MEKGTNPEGPVEEGGVFEAEEANQSLCSPGGACGHNEWLGESLNPLYPP